MHTKSWPEDRKGREHSEDLSVDGRTVSEWMLRKIRCEGKVKVKVKVKLSLCF
jgi:hypothetical protein